MIECDFPYVVNMIISNIRHQFDSKLSDVMILEFFFRIILTTYEKSH